MKKIKRFIKRKLGIALSISEIVDIVLENKNFFRRGLCQWLTTLYRCDKLTFREYDKLFRLAMKVSGNGINVYWWECGDIEPRIKFLEHIKKQTNK